MIPGSNLLNVQLGDLVLYCEGDRGPLFGYDFIAVCAVIQRGLIIPKIRVLKIQKDVKNSRVTVGDELKVNRINLFAPALISSRQIFIEFVIAAFAGLFVWIPYGISGNADRVITVIIAVLTTTVLGLVFSLKTLIVNYLRRIRYSSDAARAIRTVYTG